MLRRATLAVLALSATTALAAPAWAAAGGASWQMNEASGPIQDSLGSNERGTLGTGVTHTALPGGGRGLSFKAQGVVRVADAESLRPGNRNITLEARIRPSQLGDRNIVQKGLFSPSSQQYKMELVGGAFNCVFKGTGGDQRVGNATGVKNTAKAGVWQTVQCRKTGTSISLVVNGVTKATKRVNAGSIGTYGKPLTIGGKIDCGDECDYYLGYVDYVKVSIG